MEDYRVSLDIYNGPMDLLLYLIRRDEIDVHDIPIARITEQYCSHVAVLKQIDPDLAGEFLVMAATLMEIKTRMLLPGPEQEGEGEAGFDPRADLVRQLLQYKAFKDVTDDLRVAAADQALRFPRRPMAPEQADDGKDLEDVQMWDLVDAFNDLMKATGQNVRPTEIVYDDTPIELHATDILDRLARDGDMSFRQIFAGRTRLTEMVGLFLALLELIRRRRVYVEQDGTFGEIHVHLDPDPPADAAEPQAPPPAPTADERHRPDEDDGPAAEEGNDTTQENGHNVSGS